MELTTEDRNKLLKAVDQIFEVLGIIVREDLQYAIDTSYKNAQVDLIPMFSESLVYAKEDVEYTKRQIQNANSDPNSDLVRKLYQHNLTGKPLDWKTQIVKVEHDNYLNRRNDKRPSFLKKLIGKCLGGFDILLESLADCIPGLGAVTEFKKGLEYVTKSE
jgi:transcriptional regulator of met regulon